MDTAQKTTPTNGHANGSAANGKDVVIDVRLQALYYGTFKAVRDTHILVQKTVWLHRSHRLRVKIMLRSINSMNDLIRGFRFEGHVHYRGKDIYAKSIDPVAVRRYIGMVFQQPNPFAMSELRNVASTWCLNAVGAT